mgnify:CR=1 FL=1
MPDPQEPKELLAQLETLDQPELQVFQEQLEPLESQDFKDQLV